jgi:hypothetical protein
VSTVPDYAWQIGPSCRSTLRNWEQIWTPRAAQIIEFVRDLARTACRYLFGPPEQFRVDAVALDETVKPIATTTATLIAFDVEHIELAD